MAYKIQTRKPGEVRFVDTGAWLTCAKCIEQMRAMSPLSEEMQIVDEEGYVVATTSGIQEMNIWRRDATGDSRSKR